MSVTFKPVDLRVNLYEPQVKLQGVEKWREHWKQLAEERLPELADELRRRSFTKVDLVLGRPYEARADGDLGYSTPGRVEAQIVGARGEVHLYASVSMNLDRPYVVQFAINDEIEYKILVRGRELSFDAALLLVDDFLAGMTAGKRI